MALLEPVVTAPGSRAMVGRARRCGAPCPREAGLDEEADYVVVGAGTAGCILAARLSEDPGARVVLLEAGPADRDRWIHQPAGYARLLESGR